VTSFTDFALGAPILKALADTGYTAPTPIQAQAITPILEGRDLCGIAQTGTGKTAAFALPILQNLTKAGGQRTPRGARVLVLSPTRELASQIAKSFETYGAGLDIRTAIVFGGVSQRAQVQALARGVDVLVATPGRLLDLVEQRAITLGTVEVLVVDEADQMLDLGFIVPLKKIVRLIPQKRQTLFFSATMPKTISQLADSLLSNPIQVAVAPVATTAEKVEQSVIFVSTGDKQRLLEKLLSDPDKERVLVFTRTKHGADKVVKNLVRAGVEAAAIHGNKSQANREKALASFKSGGTRVLVATDIAARGIHVENVSHVINYDLPNIPESYVHRIGRTARAGAAGIAISFCNGEERAFLRDIEKLTRIKVPVAPMPEGLPAAMAPLADEEPRREQRRGNGRPQQRGGAQRNSGQGRQGQQASGDRSGGNRSNSGRNSNRPQSERQANPARSDRPRSDRPVGFDATTGLPNFFTQPQRRDGQARP
jgi:ATP-dependent RNA helicase RhlE